VLNGLKVLNKLSDKFDSSTMEEKKQMLKDLEGMMKRITEGQ